MDTRILLGVIGRPHGVRGLVHVTSYTDDPAALTAYGPLSDEGGRRFRLSWRGEGVAAVEMLTDAGAEPVRDRDAAGKLTNVRLYVGRDALPPPDDADEVYVADLIGLAAVAYDGATLGTVVAVHDYGGGTSLEIGRDGAAPLLLPFTRAAVPAIDLAARRLIVTPPAEIEARPA